MRSALCLTGRWLLGAAAAAVLASPAAAAGSSPGPGGIYSCVDERGRRLTSDRPIPECNAREQKVLNKDGSVRGVRPPTLTADEQAEADARERRAAEQRAALADAVRRDRNLMQRYRDEAAHQRAREGALDSVRTAQRGTQTRIGDLARERKPLVEEAEFFKGRPLPAKLRSQLESNDAAMAAQRDAMASQQAEIERINRFYDLELARLRRLWGGAQPGSLGAIEVPRPSAPPASAP